MKTLAGHPILPHSFLVNIIPIKQVSGFLFFIVSAVLLMGIAGTLPSDGVISILSAIVGYVFGRATAAK